MIKFILSMLLGIGIVLLLPSITKDNYIEAHAPVRTVKNYSVPELIEHYAVVYNQDPQLLKSVAYCESRYKTSLKGDGGRAYSVFQIHKPTFERWEKQMGQDLDYNNYRDHIKLAAWAFSKGESYRDDWTTYVAIRKGGTYSFYSKLLKKHYTIRCNMLT